MTNSTNMGRIVLLTSIQRLVLRDALATYQLARKDETLHTAHAAWRAETGVAPETDAYSDDAMAALVKELDDALSIGPSTAEERIAAIANEIEFGDAVLAFGVSRDANPYAKAAWEASDEGFEVDETTVVSKSLRGSYVLAWHFVSDEEAGCEPASALLESLADTLREVIETPLARVQSGSDQWDASRVKRLAAYLEWLDETLGNFADEIDDLVELVEPAGAFGEVHFAHQGDTHVITPSTALSEMLNACDKAVETTGRAQRIREAVTRIGPLLDTTLAWWSDTTSPSPATTPVS